MGVLPLEFMTGTNRLTLHIDGTETYDVVGKLMPRGTLTLVVHRKSGEKVEIPTKVVTSETLKEFVQPDLPDNVWLLGTQLPPEELKKQATR